MQGCPALSFLSPQKLTGRQHYPPASMPPHPPATGINLFFFFLSFPGQATLLADHKAD